MSCICKGYPALVRVDCPMHGEGAPYGPKRDKPADGDSEAQITRRIREARESELRWMLNQIQVNRQYDEKTALDTLEEMARFRLTGQKPSPK